MQQFGDARERPGYVCEEADEAIKIKEAEANSENLIEGQQETPLSLPTTPLMIFA